MLQTISLISLLIAIMLLRRIVNILPSVFSCLVNPKECINIDSYIKTKNDRDITAAVLLIPFFLTMNRYGILSYHFMSGISPEAGFGITAGVFGIYLIFRIFISKIFILNKNRNRARVIDYSDRTFFIILAVSAIALSWLMGITNAGTETIRHTIIWVSAAIYAVYLIRKFQLFQSNHSIFTAFLYLCALEIIPTGTLVVATIIF